MNDTDFANGSAFETSCIGMMGRFLIYADWFIWLALWIAGITAVIAAVVAIVNVLRGKKKENPEAAGSITDVITATKELIDSLAKAPSWFAMFLAGILLFWVASYAAHNHCAVPRFDLGDGSNAADNAAAGNTVSDDDASTPPANATSPVGNGNGLNGGKRKANAESGG